jgi:hypothetical protein
LPSLLPQVLQSNDARVQHRALQLLTDLVHGNKALRQQALQVRLLAQHMSVLLPNGCLTLYDYGLLAAGGSDLCVKSVAE